VPTCAWSIIWEETGYRSLDVPAWTLVREPVVAVNILAIIILLKNCCCLTNAQAPVATKCVSAPNRSMARL
jgi:hypothetical protein